MAPFRITPASKPGAGGQDHWEGAASYGNSHGSEWFELDRTIDEGYDDPDVMIPNPVYLAAQTDYDNYDIGDDLTTDGFTWNITNRWENSYTFNRRRYTSYFFSLERIQEGAHHVVNFNYWHVYNYSFLEWNYLREERRSA